MAKITPRKLKFLFHLHQPALDIFDKVDCHIGSSTGLFPGQYCRARFPKILYRSQEAINFEICLVCGLVFPNMDKKYVFAKSLVFSHSKFVFAGICFWYFIKVFDGLKHILYHRLVSSNCLSSGCCPAPYNTDSSICSSLSSDIHNSIYSSNNASASMPVVEPVELLTWQVVVFEVVHYIIIVTQFFVEIELKV